MNSVAVNSRIREDIWLVYRTTVPATTSKYVGAGYVAQLKLPCNEQEVLKTQP